MKKHFKWINPFLFIALPFFFFAYIQVYKRLSWDNFTDLIIWFWILEGLLMLVTAVIANISSKEYIGPKLRFILLLSSYIVIILLPPITIAKSYFFPEKVKAFEEEEICKMKHIQQLVLDDECSEDMIQDEKFHLSSRLYVEGYFTEFPKDTQLVKEAYLLISEREGYSSESGFKARIRYLGVFNDGLHYSRKLIDFEELKDKDSLLYTQWQKLAWDIEMNAGLDSIKALQECD